MAKEVETTAVVQEDPKPAKKAVKKVDTQAFVNRKLTVLNNKGGARYEALAARVVAQNK